jgi:hypothetical protein
VVEASIPDTRHLAANPTASSSPYIPQPILFVQCRFPLLFLNVQSERLSSGSLGTFNVPIPWKLRDEKPHLVPDPSSSQLIPSHPGKSSSCYTRRQIDDTTLRGQIHNSIPPNRKPNRKPNQKPKPNAQADHNHESQNLPLVSSAAALVV